MPIYMDRHDIPGVTALHVAEVHKQDVKLQGRYDCRALTYWFDEAKGLAFCLIEAPTKEAVERLHDEAHGLIPKKIIEVDRHLVEAFLGRISDPESAVGADDTGLQVFEDPAFRTIMATQLKDAALLKPRYGVTDGLRRLKTHDETVQEAIRLYEGLQVQKAKDGFLASFASASKAVRCASEIQDRFRALQTSGVGMQVAIGLSAGEPVTGGEDFFGEAVQLARRLAYIGRGGQVLVSSAVRDEYQREEGRVVGMDRTLRLLGPMEEQFLDEVMDAIEEVWNDEGLTVEAFGRRVGLSRSQLYRKVTALTGYSANGFIREYRRRRALELLERRQGNIAGIAFETGFANPSYFAKCFRKRFGILPSEYARAVA